MELAKQLLLVELAGYDVDILRLPTYDSRIAAIQNGTVRVCWGRDAGLRWLPCWAATLLLTAVSRHRLACRKGVRGRLPL